MCNIYEKAAHELLLDYNISSEIECVTISSEKDLINLCSNPLITMKALYDEVVKNYRDSITDRFEDLLVIGLYNTEDNEKVTAAEIVDSLNLPEIEEIEKKN